MSVFALTLGAIAGGVQLHRSHNVRVPLLTDGIGISADGSLHGASNSAKFFPNSLVFESTDPRALERAAQQRAWLASGQIPGSGGPYEDMVRVALLDIKTLTLPNGASLAAWPPLWRYTWPRDASMVAVTLAVTGHSQDAVDILRFLQQQQVVGQPYQARYKPDGSGPPDARGVQVDGTGWTLWATAQVLSRAPTASRAGYRKQLEPLIRHDTEIAMRLTDRPGGLPAASSDYWEVKESALTLGTAAPLAAGLRAAASLQVQLGDDKAAAAATARAAELGDSIRDVFGSQNYPRHLGSHDPDASLAFLLPPFSARADPTVVRAWHAEMRDSVRRAGGYAPGTRWKNDGISWTPTTALFALTAAQIGDRSLASKTLDWLDQHRTALGSLPEKVLSNGSLAGPAPLAWTAALVILAVNTYDH